MCKIEMLLFCANIPAMRLIAAGFEANTCFYGDSLKNGQNQQQPLNQISTKSLGTSQ